MTKDEIEASFILAPENLFDTWVEAVRRQYRNDHDAKILSWGFIAAYVGLLLLLIFVMVVLFSLNLNQWGFFVGLGFDTFLYLIPILWLISRTTSVIGLKQTSQHYTQHG